MKEVLVTGGSGFIGSHLIDTLCERGDKVYNIDWKSPRMTGPLQFTYYAIDISKLDEQPIFVSPTAKFNEIYHLAAQPWTKSDEDWIYESEETMNSNIIGTLKVLTKQPSDLLVFASTANLYGSGRKFKETDPMDISSSYGYSKAICERMISLSGARHVIFRFGTVVGIRGRCFPNRLVWCAINNIPVEIFNMGDTYRDLIDVRDVVSAMLSAKNLEDGIYNISCGMEISGKVLAHQVFNEAHDRGYDLQYNFTDFVAPGYVLYSTLDISKILKTGEWKPKITLKQTISDLFDYYEGESSIEPPRWDVI